MDKWYLEDHNEGATFLFETKINKEEKERREKGREGGKEGGRKGGKKKGR